MIGIINLYNMFKNTNTRNYIILGDLNGHTGFLGPQSMNKNGEIMLDLIDKNNLILLNGQPECKGEITWQQRECKIIIDYLIIDAELHQRFEKMTAIFTVKKRPKSIQR